jgi:hypothetical protein
VAKEKQNSEQIFFSFSNSSKKSVAGRQNGDAKKQNNQTKQKMLKFFFKNDELFGKFNFFQKQRLISHY